MPACQSIHTISTLSTKTLLILALLLATQVRPAWSFNYLDTTPIVNNFINQLDKSCRQKQESGAEEKTVNCTPIKQNSVKLACVVTGTPANVKCPTYIPPPPIPLNTLSLEEQCKQLHATLIGHNCVPPLQISLADCRLQGTTLECFIQPRAEIASNGVVQMTPLMPLQGLEIKQTGIEGMLQPGVVVLPNMCKQSHNEWDCQVPTTGQMVRISPASAK
jgi:hypothetical protein